jgi:lysozyme family protein
VTKNPIDFDFVAFSRRRLLRLASGFATVAATSLPALYSACAQTAGSASFEKLLARASALGIQVSPGGSEKAVGTKSLQAPLSPLVDVVNEALDLSLKGNPEAAQLAQDAGELLSQINRLIRQPTEPEIIKKVYKFDDLKADYRVKFDGCRIGTAHVGEIQSWADRLSSAKYRTRYDALSSMTSVPWYIVAVIHYRECSANFMGHLHNGDPLKARTFDVPKNRPDPPWPPSPWDPVAAWEMSATDALKLDNFYDQKEWTLERSLFRLERFNGFGTRSHGVNPNYLWNFSGYPTRGGYNSDGHYKPDYVSSQCGTAVILKMWVNKGIVIFPPSA